MFIKQLTHSNLDQNKDIKLTFLQSLNVQVYPCGRRRSAVQNDGENYYIPFDPEARLNTEFNNRKLASANGFTESYIDIWNADNAIKICWDGTATETYKTLGSNTFYKVSEPIDTLVNGIVCLSNSSGADTEILLNSANDIQVVDGGEYTQYVVNVQKSNSTFKYATDVDITFETPGLYFFYSEDTQVSSFTIDYENIFSFTLGGYTFIINLNDPVENTNIRDVQTFATKILDSLGASSDSQIYANIKLEEI
jgi:hypothetical protein